MNFGKAILILVQRLSKLNKASDILKKKGYYDNWPKECDYLLKIYDILFASIRSSEILIFHAKIFKLIVFV